METIYYITGSDLLLLLWLVIYIGLGVLSCRYGMKQGYRLRTASLISYLITPVFALILFKFIPRN